MDTDMDMDVYTDMDKDADTGMDTENEICKNCLYRISKFLLFGHNGQTDVGIDLNGSIVFSSVSNNIFLNPFTICSSCKQKFVLCPFVYEETNEGNPFENIRNRRGHL
jgi:hypothetical protein